MNRGLFAYFSESILILLCAKINPSEIKQLNTPQHIEFL